MWRCPTGFGVIPRIFDGEKDRFSLIAAASINCDFRGRPNEKERQMPYAVTSDKVRLYFEEAGSGTPIIFLHEFAADHTNWELADAIFLARAPLHRLFRARLRTIRCAAVVGCLHLQAFLHRRTGRARSFDDRESAFRRPVDGILFFAADRPERAGARIVTDTCRRRLGLGPQQSRCLPQAMPGQ